MLISSGVQPSGGKSCWGSGFLPSSSRACSAARKGDPVLYVSDPPGMDRDMRRLEPRRPAATSTRLQAKELGHPETLTRIAQYELAFRMQTVGPRGDGHLARSRRRRSRPTAPSPARRASPTTACSPAGWSSRACGYVQLFDWGWDFHGTGADEDIRDGLTKKCATMDQAGRGADQGPEARGLLDDTLVIWGGEFGRTPFREGRTAGGKRPRPRPLPRLLHAVCWPAAASRPATRTARPTNSASTSPRTWSTSTTCRRRSCTCLGFDHTKLTYRFQGRDYRLTDVHGKVVKEILA